MSRSLTWAAPDSAGVPRPAAGAKAGWAHPVHLDKFLCNSGTCAVEQSGKVLYRNAKGTSTTPLQRSVA
jgi:hypothetical protein